MDREEIGKMILESNLNDSEEELDAPSVEGYLLYIENSEISEKQKMIF
jgi:hypothetical protein